MMYVLIVKSLRTSDSLRVELTPLKAVRVGRSSKADLSIPWDPAISREHADISLINDQLQLKCLPSARNPAVLDGQPIHEFTLQSGHEFRIGTTSFRFENAEISSPAAAPSEEGIRINTGTAFIHFNAIDDTPNANQLEKHSFAPGELNRFAFGRADERIEMLSKLPKLIADADSDEELALSLAGLLLQAIPKATAVAVAQFQIDELPDDNDPHAAFPKPIMLRIDTRDRFDGTFRPSRRLISQALRTQESVIQIWHGEPNAAKFTMSDGLGWAIVTPIAGKSCEGWCLYISGAGSEGTALVTQASLIGDLRCAELISQFIASIRQVRLLEVQKTRMSSFFSPKVMDSLNNITSHQTLAPTERDVAVLFCDVRNFSSMAEELKNDLLTLHAGVRSALGIMTDGILDFDGTIADFQGDAALGFWGWPVENPAGPLPACLAAIKILEGFHQLNDQQTRRSGTFSIGIGIAFGRALAGEIGTKRQSKVGVFGPVVNAGARLQGLSKKFGVPICVDEPTAEYLREHLSSDVATVRRLGNVIPQGMSTPMNIFALEPTSLAGDSRVDDTVRQSFEFAVDAVQAGHWDQATEILLNLPENDGPTRFLKQFIAEQGANAPATWTGTIEFQNK